MSTAVEETLDFAALSTSGESAAQRRIQSASAVRWVWQPFRDIKLVTNAVEFVNSLTLRGSENIDWIAKGEKQPEPITVLRRCQPYPLTNCEKEIPAHEARRYGMTGDEIPENDLPGNYSGANPRGGQGPRKFEAIYAYSSARELSDRYSEDYGFVVLEPLTGVEDSDVVKQVFALVQPKTYKLSRLETELVDAKQRIEQAKVDKKLKEIAEGCRLLMLAGCRKALLTAKRLHGELSMDIQRASAGQKGYRAAPNEFDEEIADQLGVEVPRVVQTVRKSDRTEELLHAVAEATTQKDDGLAAALLAELREEREERKRLSAQIGELLAAKQEGKGAQPSK